MSLDHIAGVELNRHWGAVWHPNAALLMYPSTFTSSDLVSKKPSVIKFTADQLVIIIIANLTLRMSGQLVLECCYNDKQ